MSQTLTNELFETSVVYEANKNSTAFITVNQGGTSSGKTYSLMQLAFTAGIENPGELITVVSQTIPAVKDGPLADAKAIVADSPVLNAWIKDYNATDRVYTLINGTIIQFKAYADWKRAKSGKRDRLIIDEVNNIAKRICEELIMRTRTAVYLAYNPNEEFWVHTDYLTVARLASGEVRLIRSWHQHNPFLSAAMHERIENISDPELHKVYARGKTGKIEGLIFRNWEEIKTVPATAKKIASGMDFGFTNDPTTLTDVYEGDGWLYLDERIYSTGLTSGNISERLNKLSYTRRDEIIADSADPKTIEELNQLNWYVVPAKKGDDSIRASINILKKYKLGITDRSRNLKKELKSYKWKQDKQGKILNEPVDFLNHAIDGVRYVALNKLGGRGPAKKKYSVMTG